MIPLILRFGNPGSAVLFSAELRIRFQAVRRMYADADILAAKCKKQVVIDSSTGNKLQESNLNPSQSSCP